MNVTVGKDTITVQVLPKDKSPDDLILSKVKAAKKEDETTFYMMDVDRLLKLHQDWVEAMPSVAPFYAMKVNPDPLLLKTLIALGCGFDCGSKGEIKTILDLGGSPEKIMYSNPIKMLSHIQYAAENNVRMMAFDSEPELPRIKSYFPTAQLVLRIKADDPTTIGPVGEKYGCTLPEAYKLLETAKELGLDVIGVSFHVGWRCRPSAYEMALEISAKVFQYAEKLGYHFTLVNVGGGFSCCTTPADIDQFQKQAASVNKGLQQYFAGYPNLKAIGEPGTYFCCSTHSLVVRVVGKKKISNPNPDVASFMYYITDGVYGSFNMVLHGIPPRVPPVVIREDQTSSTDQRFKSTVWGPSLDSHDKVMDAVSLPEVEVGEWLCIKSMGAYSEAIASRFNAMPAHENYYCVSEAKSKVLKELGLSS